MKRGESTKKTENSVCLYLNPTEAHVTFDKIVLLYRGKGCAAIDIEVPSLFFEIQKWHFIAMRCYILIVKCSGCLIIIIKAMPNVFLR